MKFQQGAKVRFVLDTSGENYRGEEVPIKTGDIGTIEKIINDSSLYVKVNGHKLVVWTDEVEAV